MDSQIGHLATITASWREQLLDFLFPPNCVGCHRVGESLCSHCLSTTSLVTPPFCPRCNHAIAFQGEPCSQCRAYPLHITQIRAVAFHEGVLRKAIHEFKYRGRRELDLPLSGLLVDYLSSSPIRFDLITAVPLHQRRERERGYNQSELLAKHVSRRLGMPYISGLVRTRETQDQVGLDGQTRRENMRGAFLADRADFRGARVLIVDDVCTTGATLDACANALHLQGAAFTYGLTIARPR